MSRQDNLHFSLRRTLEKDGWIITGDPLVLVLEDTFLKADIGAEKFLTAYKGNQKIAVEIKNFDNRSVISELEKTMGQLQLFLAVSQIAYIKHFQKPIFQLALKRSKINLLVYEPIDEVIVQWINP